ncbi:MAG TPA: carbohydrate-binding protein, partial [Thermoanaerobaculia bacterium]
AAQAQADPLPGSQGVMAKADADFQNSCGQFGNAYTFTYSRATTGTTTTTKTQEDPKYDGDSLDSAATTSVSGSLDCYSEAYARVWSPALGINYEVSDTNFACPNPSSPNQTPFNGTPFLVPGTIKAADFDNGGEGVAYHETSQYADNDSDYRVTDVDLYEDYVVRLDTGDWMEYTIDVVAAGTYSLVAQVHPLDPHGSFHVELDGVNVTGPISVPDDGGTFIGASAIKPGVHFPAGRHVLRVVVDNSFYGFYALRIVQAQTPFGGTPWPLPGTIDLVDFDEGGEQIAYHDNTVGCYGTCERLADVDYYRKVLYLTSVGEWMEYTVNVTASGIYNLAIQVGAEQGGGIFHVEFNGVDVTGPLTVPTTGSWVPSQTVIRTGVSLSAGRQIMRIVMDARPSDSGEVGSFETISIQP